MTGLIDLKTIQRPASPNTALFAPPGFAGTAETDGAAPVYNVPPGELYMRLVRLIGERPEWQLGEQDAAGLRVNFVAVTPILRFKDDVDVQVLPAVGQPGKSTFAAYSRSRVGYSDMGANRKRLMLLANALEPT